MHWVSFITLSGEPVAINLDQAQHIEPYDLSHVEHHQPPAVEATVIDGFVVRNSFQSVVGIIGDVNILPAEF